MTTVLVVEDEPTARDTIAKILIKHDYEVFESEDLATAQECLNNSGIDIVLLDVYLPDCDNALVLLELLAQDHPRPPVIVFTAHGDIEMAVKAMKTGAFDFMAKPIDTAHLLASLERASEQVALHRELTHLRQERQANYDWVESKSQAMEPVKELVARTAAAPTPLLILGETGTGKNLVSKLIHDLSPRSQKPFIRKNCAAIPPHLLESDLFGHEKGAFTHAEKKKLGLMEVAKGGTLFLDEISTISPELQAKLLHSIDEKYIRHVGATQEIKVDFRLIAATNSNLSEMVAAGDFRQDLYWRLKVVEITLPPLRDRRDDIPALAGAFIRKLAPEHGKVIEGIHPPALEAMMTYGWPGNIRELHNAVEHGVLFCDGDMIEIGHLPHELRTHQD